MAVVFAQSHDIPSFKLSMPEAALIAHQRLYEYLDDLDRTVLLRLAREERSISERGLYTLAPEIPSDLLPKSIDLVTPAPPPDFREYTRRNIFIVSERFKACVDAAGGAGQNFHPLTLEPRFSGEVRPREARPPYAYYFWVIDTVLDAVCTEGAWAGGVKPVARGSENLALATGDGSGSRSRCAVRAAAIDGHPAWFDMRHTQPFVSDAVWQNLTDAGVSGMLAQSEWAEV
ncbi:hypothetical protein [Litorisediminicola beolgyonensis]|uniref:Uncharacterized protein n=1 Tax=Litorisediminicola beolgyonensis TaxID=1173614 RepID=A0ABW3ZIN8_9RHOB